MSKSNSIPYEYDLEGKNDNSIHIIILSNLREGFKKKVWNFPYFSGVGGFEKVIFHKK